MDPLLLVDDNPDVLIALSLLFQVQGYPCITAASPDAAWLILNHRPVSLVITDMNFHADTTSGEEGQAFFFALRERFSDLPIILLTGWADLSMAVSLAKAGATDYFAKPWDNDRLLSTVKNLLELAELAQLQQDFQQERNAVRQQLSNQFDLQGFVYESQVMQQLISTALQVARAPVPVLITGPNGAGKEKVAELIQRNSSVKNGPFIRINAGAIPTELMEAELFGAEPGAYSGLSKTRIGHFEMADGGTLFLDEIGNLPLSGQMKLLRLLQTGEFQRLGSSQTRKAQVRLISATNSDLPAAIAQGHFREDLYYRINLIELNLPPLKERRADIMPLARHFLAGRPISHNACRLLEAHDWPGNVRELSNAIARALLLASGPSIEAEDLRLPPGLKCKNRPIYEPSEGMIREALNHSSNHAQAARSLGLSRQALYRRLEKLGIRPQP
jgi:DNA-binding NtrC family response regulator